jgi:hypothetical protein
MDYNPDKTGALLIFKDGVSKEQARKALEDLKALLDYETIQEFDSRWGGPVWYIP